MFWFRRLYNIELQITVFYVIAEKLNAVLKDCRNLFKTFPAHLQSFEHLKPTGTPTCANGNSSNYCGTRNLESSIDRSRCNTFKWNEYGNEHFLPPNWFEWELKKLQRSRSQTVSAELLHMLELHQTILSMNPKTLPEELVALVNLQEMYTTRINEASPSELQGFSFWLVNFFRLPGNLHEQCNKSLTFSILERRTTLIFYQSTVINTTSCQFYRPSYQA